MINGDSEWTHAGHSEAPDSSMLQTDPHIPASWELQLQEVLPAIAIRKAIN